MTQPNLYSGQQMYDIVCNYSNKVFSCCPTNLVSGLAENVRSICENLHNLPFAPGSQPLEPIPIIVDPNPWLLNNPPARQPFNVQEALQMIEDPWFAWDMQNSCNIRQEILNDIFGGNFSLSPANINPVNSTTGYSSEQLDFIKQMGAVHHYLFARTYYIDRCYGTQKYLEFYYNNSVNNFLSAHSNDYYDYADDTGMIIGSKLLLAWGDVNFRNSINNKLDFIKPLCGLFCGDFFNWSNEYYWWANKIDFNNPWNDSAPIANGNPSSSGNITININESKLITLYNNQKFAGYRISVNDLYQGLTNPESDALASLFGSNLLKGPKNIENIPEPYNQICDLTPPPGACCFNTGFCSITTQPKCLLLGGVWQGNNTECDPNPCMPPLTGACCDQNGDCSILTSGDCSNIGGTWQGLGVACYPNPCTPPPSGACCEINGNCSITTSAYCSSIGGTWQGADTVCDPNPCPQPSGACCDINGNCSILTSGDCSNIGGTWQGADTVCDPNPCVQPPQPSGACFLNGSCTTLTSEECNSIGGSWQGADTVCQLGCCINGSIDTSITDSESCDIAGGTWLVLNNPIDSYGLSGCTGTCSVPDSTGVLFQSCSDNNVCGFISAGQSESANPYQRFSLGKAGNFMSLPSVSSWFPSSMTQLFELPTAARPTMPTVAWSWKSGVSIYDFMPCNAKWFFWNEIYYASSISWYDSINNVKLIKKTKIISTLYYLDCNNNLQSLNINDVININDPNIAITNGIATYTNTSTYVTGGVAWNGPEPSDPDIDVISAIGAPNTSC